tara:strand:- start:1585 stop:1872 length:288 start_codon:yes stop_codon:yes gene_type:complete
MTITTTTNEPTKLRKLLNELETPAERSARIKNLTENFGAKKPLSDAEKAERGRKMLRKLLDELDFKPYKPLDQVTKLEKIKLRIQRNIDRILAQQ